MLVRIYEMQTNMKKNISMNNISEKQWNNVILFIILGISPIIIVIVNLLD